MSKKEQLQGMRPANQKVIDSSALTFETFDKMEFDEAEEVDYIDTWESLPDFISSFSGWGDNTDYGGYKLLGESADLREEWTPSLYFPGFRCVNLGVFGEGDTIEKSDYPEFAIFTNKKFYDENLAKGRARYSNPTSNQDWFCSELTNQLCTNDSNGVYNISSNIFKFLVWTAMIIKYPPKKKAFKENKSRNVFESANSNEYFNLEKLFAFPSENVMLNSSEIFGEPLNRFISLVKEYLTQCDDKISLVTDFLDDSSVNKTIIDIINSVIIDDPDIDDYPAVIDETLGSYSTEDSIISIISAIDVNAVKSRDTRGYYMIESMADYDASEEDNPGLFTGDTPFFNVKEYASIFAKALNDLLSFDVWKDYNTSAAVNFILDKWCIDKLENSNVTTGADSSFATNLLMAATGESAASLEKTVSYDLNVVGDAADLSSNDLRAAIRKSRKRSIYSLSDYNWSMNSTPMINVNPDNYQRLDIFEFQPDRQLSYKRLADGLISTFKSALETSLGATAATFARIEAVGIDKEKAQNYSTNVSWIDQMLDGYWVGQYSVPYFGDKYLNAGTSSGWSMGNLLSTSEVLVNDMTFNAQDIPTWKYTSGSDEEFEFKFCLLNDNIDNIIKNYRFLFAFIAGAFWLQDDAISYRTPNIYRVFCPGRFVMLYAAMDVTVKYLGKIHAYSSADAQKMFGMAEGAEEFARFIAAENECNIPEAFELTVKFKNLTPQAFNVFASYQMAKASNIYPKITTEKITRHIATWDGIKTTAIEVKDKALDYASKATDLLP